MGNQDGREVGEGECGAIGFRVRDRRVASFFWSFFRSPAASGLERGRLDDSSRASPRPYPPHQLAREEEAKKEK